MADRLVSLLVDVTPGGNAYDALGNIVTGPSSPYIYLGERIQLSLQFISGAPPADISQIVKYTGFASSTIACEGAVDNNYTHYAEGSLTANKSGSITALSLSGLTNAPRATSGTVQLVNSAGQHESVNFTGYSVSSGVYTFTVSATLTYIYLLGDTVRVLEPPIISVSNADIDQTNKATGLFILNVDGSTAVFESLVKGVSKVSGISSLGNPVFEFKAYISGAIAFVSVFEIKCLNLINFTDVISPAIESNYYTKTETDSRYLRDAPSDTKKYLRKDGAWFEVTATGDVVGPASASSNNITSFDGITGKLLKDSGISTTAVSGHIASTSNPHNVTATQVGLGNVLNSAQLVAASNLSDLASATTARTNLGLGTAAVENVGTATFNANKLQSIPVSGTTPISGQVLSYDGSNWVPGTVSGTGDVVGPAASTDNALARFDSTTGKAIQNSSVTADDNGSINIPSGQTYKVNNIEIIPTVYTDKANNFVTVNSTANGVEFSDKDSARMKVAADPIPNGIEDATKLTASYNVSTRVMTFTYASGFAYWCQGTRYTPTGTYSFTAHANTTGTYFFFWNSTNTPTVSTTPWSILTDVQTVYVYYNATSGLALMYADKHPANTYTSQGMSSVTHEYLHKLFGAQVASGTGLLSGYTLNTAGTVALQYAVSQAIHVDEDYVNMLPAVVSTATKRVQYRVGIDAENDWRWNDTVTTGILDNGTDLYYNQNNAGTWQLTAITSNNTWVNYWIVAKPSRSLNDSSWDYPVCAIMGQTTHGSLVAAQAEDPSVGISWGTVYPQEFVVVARVTYRRVSGSSPSNAQIADVAIIRSNKTTLVSGLSPSNHSLLTNRSDANSHPATAITNTPAGNIAATNVQTALNELDTEKVALSGNETIEGIKTFSSSPIVPAPTTDMQAATKKYVDDNGGGGDMTGYPAVSTFTESGKVLSTSVAGDANTVLQLHLDTTFADSSGNSRDVTTAGSAAISSTQSKFGGASAYFPNTTSYADVTIPTIGTGDFSIEFWARPTSSTTGFLELGSYTDSNGILWHATSVQLNGVNILPYTAASNDTWHHFCLDRASGTLRLFIDGTLSTSASATQNITRTDLRIGAMRYNSAYGLVSYLDEFRVSNISRHTANFTPATSAYTDITKSVTLIQPDISRCQGRLTLESGVAISTTDQTAKTTLYFTGSGIGNQIALPSAAGWEIISFTEASVSLSTCAASTNYDVFAYSNSGTLALELTAWTSDTARATALTTQNGVYVKTGALTRRYLGTIRTTATAGQCEDSVTKRFVWNYYNQKTRTFYVAETTDSWTYSTDTWRQANNSISNQVACVVGYPGSSTIDLTATSGLTSSGTNGAGAGSVAIGINSTSAASGIGRRMGTSFVNTFMASCYLSHVPIAGYTYYAWLERGFGADIQTWYGDSGADRVQSGMIGKINN